MRCSWPEGRKMRGGDVIVAVTGMGDMNLGFKSGSMIRSEIIQ